MKTRILSLIAFVLTVHISLHAQPIIRGQKAAGGNRDDRLKCMASTSDGGFIVGGYSNSDSSFEKTQNSKGALDYWVVKYNKAGNIEWNRTIGGNSFDYMYAIQQTSDGGYILGGYSVSYNSGDMTDSTYYDYNYWIVKLDKKGNKLWDRTYGGNGIDFLYALQQTKDGGFILGGGSTSDSSGNKSSKSYGNMYNDYWIVKVNSNGDKEWDKTFGGDKDDILLSLIQTPDGGYLLGGNSQSDISGAKTEALLGNYDEWIIKLDAYGNKQWDRSIGGSEGDILGAVLQSKDGNYIVAGTSFSDVSGEKSQPGKGEADFWLVKIDKLGKVIWDRTIGGNYLDYINAASRTSDGGYILAGESSSPISGDKTEAGRGDYDYWVVKVDSNGLKQWDKTIGGNSVDRPYGIIEIAPNNYIVAGASESGPSYDKTEKRRSTKYRDADYWIVLLSYKKQSFADVKISLNNTLTYTNHIAYPNPVKDILHIQSTGKATFTLVNSLGKNIVTRSVTGNGEINVAQLPAGLYYLKNNANGTIQKIIITR